GERLGGEPRGGGALLAEVEDPPHGDAVGPRGERGLAAELGQAGDDADERLLGRVLRVLAIGEHGQGDGGDPTRARAGERRDGAGGESASAARATRAASTSARRGMFVTVRRPERRGSDRKSAGRRQAGATSNTQASAPRAWQLASATSLPRTRAKNDASWSQML